MPDKSKSKEEFGGTPEQSDLRAVERMIRKMAAVISCKEYGPSAIESVIASTTIRIKSILEKYPEKAAEINPKIARTHHNAYSKLPVLYLQEAENEMKSFKKKLAALAQHNTYLDAADGQFGQMVGTFRTCVRTFAMAKSIGISFPNEIEIRNRMRLLLENIVKYLIPSADTRLILGEPVNKDLLREKY